MSRVNTVIGIAAGLAIVGIYRLVAGPGDPPPWVGRAVMGAAGALLLVMFVALAMTKSPHLALGAAAISCAGSALAIGVNAAVVHRVPAELHPGRDAGYLQHRSHHRVQDLKQPYVPCAIGALSAAAVVLAVIWLATS